MRNSSPHIECKPHQRKRDGVKQETNDFFTTLVRIDLRLTCVKEYQFCPDRRWRFDYAIPKAKIAIEVEGGSFKKRTYRNKSGEFITTIGGRHNSAEGFLRDMEKYNTATSLGWHLLRVTPDDLISYKTLYLIRTTITNANNIEQ